MARPRVGIGLPLVALKGKPLVSLCSTLCTTDAEMASLVSEGAYIPYNRLLLRNLAVEQGCTHLFFMDHDVVYPPTTLTQLLAHDKDVVACHYNMKTTPRLSMAFDLEGDRIPLVEAEPGDWRLPQPGLFKLSAIGCGVMLIKLPIFEKLERPFFQVLIEGDDLIISEDVWFCERVRRAGFDVWCDPTIKVHHMGEAAY